MLTSDIRRYFVDIAYNGTSYCGWQRQPNGVSIQQYIEDAFSTIRQTETKIVGAGRTDAGVHAHSMIAHLDLNNTIEESMNLVARVNKLLPKDIVINHIREVPLYAHARFDATKRTYHYYITEKKDPFSYPYTLYLHRHLDFDKMNKAAERLFDYTDFTSFSKLHTDVKTNNCIIKEAYWIQQEGEPSRWTFVISADRFLRNMVRAIVGTMIEVGAGKRSVADFAQLIEGRDRCLAGSSAPAQGLFLHHIEYPY